MKVKKIPMRTCIGCGTVQPKKSLLRILKTPEGDILMDFTGKKAGRGAYLCKSMDCLVQARKGRKLERSFCRRIDADTYDRLYEELSDALQHEKVDQPADDLPEGGQTGHGI
jgi:predicted RNA-binding protein YlxR (DUF448 family)